MLLILLSTLSNPSPLKRFKTDKINSGLTLHRSIQRIFGSFQTKHSRNLFRISSLAIMAGGTILTFYALWGKGIFLHYDEWVGRGLYPGIAMAHGADLYEPSMGPHVTLYGCGSALFYSIAALASSPSGAIWFGFILNVFAFLGPLIYLLNRLFSSFSSSKCYSIYVATGASFLILAVLAIEPTTEGILRLHADLPAFFFLMTGLCLFDIHLRKKRGYWLSLTCLFLTLSFWAKIPTLPATFFPCFFLLLRGRIREAIHFILLLGAAFAFTTFCFTFAYGWDDTVFILYEHVKAASLWDDRNDLFSGPNSWTRRTYFEAIPILFRFHVMYLAEYWFVILSTFTVFIITLRSSKESHWDNILLNLCLIYALTLSPCLAAIAHFGGAENSLLFANATGFLIVLMGTITIASKSLPYRIFLLLTWSLASLLMLPLVRQAKSAPDNVRDSPHYQAFNYLRSGKTDVYFGWYPLSHIFHSGEIFSNIEVPTWAGMTRPNDIDYSEKHFPPNAKFLATGSTGYGSYVLQRYLGPLKEVSAPPELSNWRLYETVEKKEP